MSQTVNDLYMGARGVLPFEDLSGAGSVSGTITANAQSIVVSTACQNGAVFAWWGTFAGIGLAFEACYEPSMVNWAAVSALPAAGGSPVTTLSGLSTSSSAYEVYAPGALAVRIRATAFTSGTMNVRAIPVAMMQDIAPSVSGGSVAISGNPVLGAGANAIGDVGGAARSAAGGLGAPNRLLSAAATTNATSVKAVAGRVYRIRGYNAAAAVRYLKLYNKASAPTVGTDIPVSTKALKPGDVFDIDFGLIGQYFATGIAFSITTGSADTDTGALTAADVVGMETYYA